MNDKLAEINNLYLQIRGRYLETPMDEWLNPSQNEQAEFADSFQENTRIYNLGMEKFRDVVPSLSSVEILDGYQEGCKLLQRNLSGHMCLHFDPVYIPAMIRAIKNDDAHTAYLFLQELANRLGKEIGHVVLDALDSESALIRETALSVAEQIDLVEAAAKIKLMEHDKVFEVSALAQKIIVGWNSKANL